MQTMPKHIFWPIIDSSSYHHLHAVKVLLYAESMGVVTCGHVTKMAVKPFDSPFPKTPYANFTAASSTEPELLPIEVLHCGNSEFRVFLRKIVENIKIFRSYHTSDADDAETHFLVHYRQFQLVCCWSYTHLRCYFKPNRLVWSLLVT